MRTFRGALSLACLAGCAAVGAGQHPRIATLEAFRAAQQAGDLETARRFLSSDPRLWFGERQGEGSPWPLEGGRWEAWDEHFNGTSERVGAWHVEGDAVWGDFFETNDYYRLIEREGGYWRGTYYFDASGKLAGFLVGPSPGRAASKSRREEFEAWARANRPREAEYLMPGGSLDPSGDRAPRMRALLEEWRAAIGAGQAPD